MTVHSLLLGMMEDVNLPEREQEFADDRITHRQYPSIMRSGRGLVFARAHLGPRTQFVGAPPHDFVAGVEIAKHLHQWT